MDWAALRAPMEREKVHWRAQTLARSGDKALALAYIDARDLMERLDEVCGVYGWQDSYEETPKGRIICTLSICIDGEWISKSDGAGATDVEGDKGAISDAFKRAGVKWGVARELYDVGNVWVPCETYTSNDGKKRWKAWNDDPWNYVRGGNKPPATTKPDAKEAAAKGYVDDLTSRLQTSADAATAAATLQDEQAKIARVKTGYPELFKRIETAAKNAGAEMRDAA